MACTHHAHDVTQPASRPNRPVVIGKTARARLHFQLRYFIYRTLADDLLEALNRDSATLSQVPQNRAPLANL